MDLEKISLGFCSAESNGEVVFDKCGDFWLRLLLCIMTHVSGGSRGSFSGSVMFARERKLEVANRQTKAGRA